MQMYKCRADLVSAGWFALEETSTFDLSEWPSGAEGHISLASALPAKQAR